MVPRHESPPATVTLRMVAAHAGVSKSVVSRVLQDSPHVSPAKRAAVAAAIEELGYRPNSLARSLTQRRTNIVGVLVHDLRQPWFVDALEGLGAGLAPTGLLPFIADGRLDRTLDDRVVRSFMGLRLDGFILAGSVPETASVVAAMESIPSVAVGGRDITRPGVDLVAQDDVLGARLALDHLHGLGHRRIAHVAGAVGRSFDLRRQTYLAWMAEQGLAAESRVEVESSSEPGGYRATRTLFEAAAGSRPTAIFAGNDALAVEALSAVRDAGLTVSGDVSVIGFDGTSLAAAQHIWLTTVDTDIAGMGRRAADLLLARIADPGRERTEVLPAPRVTVRGTTGPAPRG